MLKLAKRKGFPHQVMAFASAAVISAFGAFSFVGVAGAVSVVGGCTFDDSVPGEWSLVSDCTATERINVPADTLVRGHGHTVSANFTKADGGNAIFGISGADNVTLRNIVIDGSGGTDLHGVNVYKSVGVKLMNVTIMNNDHSGLVVNGSHVRVNNITTSGNGWHGINVDQGTNVADPAVLVVTGTSHQTDAAHIYVDDTTKNVTVKDKEDQYFVTQPHINGNPNDALYTLKSSVVATEKDQCKQGGWMDRYTMDMGTFKNQGQCVSYVQSNEHSHHHNH